MLKPATLNVSWYEIQALPRDAADHLVRYGASEVQFGELRLPKAADIRGVLIFIHGGCWLNTFGVDHASAMARALAEQGYAVWSPEYRRVGDAGGGWPGTFDDIRMACDILPEVAGDFGFGLDRVIALGHSAGGQLAMWLAVQKNLAITLRGVISLAGIVDLLAYEELGNECSASLPALLGGTSREQPKRWAGVDPLRLLPLRTPATFIHGELDSIVPLTQSQLMAEATGGALHVISGGGHFDMVAPQSAAFNIMCHALQEF